MTTIVYDHNAGLVAVDGRCMTGSLINTDSIQKWIKRGDDYWFFAGSLCDREAFIDHFLDPNPAKPGFNLECSAIAVRGGKVYNCIIDQESGKPCAALVEYNDAMGSGEEFALAALDHGKTAEDAVAYAATRDSGTGGKIRVFDVAKMEFIK